MNKWIAICVGVGLLGLSLFYAVRWASSWEQPARDAWIIDRLEHDLHDVQPGQKVRVFFHLKNGFSRSLRVLGSSAC